MVGLIIKNGYIKGGSAKSASHLNHFVKYVATRDGVEKNRLKNESEKYLDYIANRPKVEIMDSHGLFNGSDKKIILSQVVKEISLHRGNIWTPIISLSREDADSTDYQTAAAWKALLSAKVFEISASLKIHPDNFRWYAAFHDEGHHPHVHLICYSTNPNEGYLSKRGIEKMKSALANEIFKQQLAPLYIQKSRQRDKLKKQAENVFRELQNRQAGCNYANPRLDKYIAELAEKLQSVKGKKQYGYLRPPLKMLINTIVDELAQEPHIKQAYDLWCELQNEIYHTYQEEMPEALPLSGQREFNSVKNMVIREVLQIEHLVLTEAAHEVTAVMQEDDKIIDIPANRQSPALGLCTMRLLNSLGKLFADKGLRDSTTLQQHIDSKQRRKTVEKKLALGQKIGAPEQENIEQRFN